MIFGLSTKEKMFFARHMSVMARAGIPTLEILAILKKQSQSGSFRKILDQMIVGVRNGRFLSDTLEKYKRVFGEFFINLIRVGEVSGTLSDNLEYLAESLRKKKELESKVRGAMIYPIIILIATVGISAVLMFYIFPKILPVFRSMKVALPLTTRIFIFVSTFFIEHGLIAGIGIVVIVAGIFLLLKIPKINYGWNYLLLHVPVFKNMIQHYNLVTYSRSMSMLLKSGVPIVQALNITERTLQNPVYKKRLKNIALQVNQGDFVSNHMVNDEFLFPLIFTQMLAVGERTGKLYETGLYLADYYESELDGSTKALSNILEPMLLVMMGGIVAFVALSIITPIYAYTSSLSR